MKIAKYDIFITFNKKNMNIYTKSLYENSKTFTFSNLHEWFVLLFNQLFCMPVQIIVKRKHFT